MFLLLFQLEFIAKAANFCLLMSLLPVSLALARIYRQREEKRPKGSRNNNLPI